MVVVVRKQQAKAIVSLCGLLPSAAFQTEAAQLRKEEQQEEEEGEEEEE
jgi:hypothetical protein